MEKKEAEKLARKEAKDKARAQAKAASLPPRRRGGQPGNHNARKHGRYSTYVTPEDMQMIQELLRVEDLDLHCEIALTRGKYRQSIKNPETKFKELSSLGHLLTDMLRTQGNIDKTYRPIEEDEIEEDEP
ncbi:MAG: hypothetical protein FJ320_12765 [SAR202 cluster bacterium]|nr:hypothetical protein [SAR202 cluster bacterium]